MSFPVPQEIRWLLKQFRPFVQLYTLDLLCTVVNGLLSLLDPLIMKWVIDHALPEKDVERLVGAAFGLLIVFSGRLLLTAIAGYLSFRVTQRMMLRMRLIVLKHLSRLSADYHDKTAVGDTLFRVEQDISEIGDLGADLLFDAQRTLILTVLTLGTMFMVNGRFTFLILPLLPAFVFIHRKHGFLLRRWSEASQQANAKRTSFLQEYIAAIVQLKLLSRERSHIRKYATAAVEAIRARGRRRFTELTFGITSLMIVVIGIVMLVGFGGYEVITGTFTVGGLVAFYGYLTKLFDPLSQVVDIDTKIQRVRTSARRTLDILNVSPSVKDKPGGTIIRRDTPCSLVFEQVSFDYVADRQVLREVSFQVRPGEKLALVGRSGSGKSTIAKLAVRLYDPMDGMVRVGALDARDIALRNLRRAVALLPQDTVLFSGTVRENLLHGNPEASQSEIEQAAEIAQILQMVQRLPNAWDEVVGPRSNRFSGGERQRLALARTLLQRPQILILDEFTSAIDAATEEEVLCTLDEFVADMAVISISHSQRTMRWADRILVLDGGRIVDEGTHMELCARSSIYTEICKEAAQGREDQTISRNERLVVQGV
jgi:ABC-type multidrug transport system fused ATPase/permease subunit